MKEKHVVFSVTRLGSGRVRVDGGKEIISKAKPDGTVQVGDTLFHVHFSSHHGVKLDRRTVQEALDKMETIIANHPGLN